MSQKRIGALLVLTLVIGLLAGLGAAPARAADPAPSPAPAASGEASGDSSGEASAGSREPLPLVPGTYEGSDGSLLKVKEDGTCTYAADVSGTVNGRTMSGRLTFHGTVEGGVFTFTRVTYFLMDLTDIATELGLTAEYWETAAGILYADGLRKAAS